PAAIWPRSFVPGGKSFTPSSTGLTWFVPCPPALLPDKGRRPSPQFLSAAFHRLLHSVAQGCQLVAPFSLGTRTAALRMRPSRKQASEWLVSVRAKVCSLVRTGTRGASTRTPSALRGGRGDHVQRHTSTFHGDASATSPRTRGLAEGRVERIPLRIYD